MAWAELGRDAAPELAVLHEELSTPFTELPSEKVAHLQDRLLVSDTPELRLLREAHEARRTYLKMASALAWVDKNMPALGR